VRLLISFLLLLTAFSIDSDYVSAKAVDRSVFYTYQQMKDELQQYELRYPNFISVQELAQTQGGRCVILLEIGKKTVEHVKPGMLAIFGQHADEHETTKMAMGFVKRLIEAYGTDAELTNLLDTSIVYIVPMANPDGSDYDMGSDKIFTTWRKNRMPTSENNYGVDLNRNWDYCWATPTTTDLDRMINDPENEYYHGKNPFSEVETKSISDFVLSHRSQIQLFLDYHTGWAGFMQGDVLIPYCYTEEQKLSPNVWTKSETVGSNLCRLLSDDKDKRKAYAIMQAYEVRKYVLEAAPFWQRPIIKSSLPASTLAPGAAIDWVASQGIMSFGIEADCSNGRVEKDAVSREQMIQHQYKGFLYLLGHLAKE